jgi:hypothetical protein
LKATIEITLQFTADMTVMETFKKNKGAIVVSAAANIGSVLFGFDTGVAGGIVALAR